MKYRLLLLPLVLLFALSGCNEEMKQENAALKGKIAQLESQLANRKGQLSGVVTYFFNDNYGDKPDVGATVYICPVEGCVLKDADKLTQYNAIATANELWRLTRMVNGEESKEAENVLKGIQRYSFIKLASDISVYFDDCDDMVRAIAHSPATVEVAADGNGGYKRGLKPGKYWVIIRSAHRKGDTGADVLGKLDINQIEIQADEETSLNARFRA